MISLIREYYDFIERHWGDYVGLILIFAGIGLTILGGIIYLNTDKSLEQFYSLGGALVTTGVGLLKLRGNPKVDSVTETETTSKTTATKTAEPKPSAPSGAGETAKDPLNVALVPPAPPEAT